MRHPDLIFDVGLHDGQDTAFYLRKGFRVVAFDANPDCIRSARAKFPRELDAGRLTLVEGAITDDPAPAVTFYANAARPWQSTIDPAWADRARAEGIDVTATTVPAVRFPSALQRYGVPYYLKIDIEAADRICLEALAALETRPAYVSIESSKTSLADIRDELALLQRLGYTGFQAVEQMMLTRDQTPPNPPREGRYVPAPLTPGGSGLFGRELPGQWMDADAIARRYRWIHLGYALLGDAGLIRRGPRPLKSLVHRTLRPLTHGHVPGWYDTHARHVSA